MIPQQNPYPQHPQQSFDTMQHFNFQQHPQQQKNAVQTQLMPQLHYGNQPMQFNQPQGAPYMMPNQNSLSNDMLRPSNMYGSQQNGVNNNFNIPQQNQPQVNAQNHFQNPMHNINQNNLLGPPEYAQPAANLPGQNVAYAQNLIPGTQPPLQPLQYDQNRNLNSQVSNTSTGKHSSASKNDKKRKHHKSQPKSQIDLKDIPNPVTHENKVLSLVDEDEATTIHYSGKNMETPPRVFEKFVCFDHGLSIPRFTRFSFNSWPANYHTANKMLPMVMSLTPFAECCDQELPVPLVDRKQLSPLRCGRCKAYVNSRSNLEIDAKFQCALCGEINNFPASYLQNFGSNDNYGVGTEHKYGTYDMEVAGALHQTENVPENQPAFVFVIEATVNSIKQAIFEKVLSAIKNFIRNDSMLDGGLEIPFVICTFGKAVNFFTYDAQIRRSRILTLSDPQNAAEISARSLLMTKSSIDENLDEFFTKILRVSQLPNYLSCPEDTFEAAVSVVSKILSSDYRNGTCFVYQTSICFPHLADEKGNLQNDQKKKQQSKNSTAQNMVQAISSLNISKLMTNDPLTKLVSDCCGNYSTVVNLCMLSDPKPIGGKALLKLLRETSGELHMLYMLKDYSVIENIILRSKSTVYNVKYKVRSSFGVKVDSIYGLAGKQDSSIYHLNAMSSKNSLEVLLKPESKNLPSDQKNILIQPAFVYTDMQGRRLVRILNSELPITPDIDYKVISKTDNDVITDYFLKRYTQEVFEQTMGQQAVATAMVFDAAAAFQIYLKTNPSTSINNSSEFKKSIGTKLTITQAIASLPCIASAIFNNMGVFPSPNLNDDLYAESVLLNLASTMETAYLIAYPLIYCFTDVMNSDCLVKLPPRERAVFEFLSEEKIYIICNSQKIILSIGEKVSETVLKMLFIDPKMHQRFIETINLSTSTVKTSQARNLVTLINLIEKRINRHCQIFVTFFPNVSNSTTVRMFEDKEGFGSRKSLRAIYDASFKSF